MTTLNSDMLEEFRTALMRNPFMPFAIVMQNGTRHRVTRQFQAGTDGSNAAIIDNRDRMTWFKIKDVIALEPITPRRQGKRRGKSR